MHCPYLRDSGVGCVLRGTALVRFGVMRGRLRAC